MLQIKVVPFLTLTNIMSLIYNIFGLIDNSKEQLASIPNCLQLKKVKVVVIDNTIAKLVNRF